MTPPFSVGCLAFSQARRTAHARSSSASRVRPVPKPSVTSHCPGRTSPEPTSDSRMNSTVADERLPPSASTSREGASWASERRRRRCTRSRISGPPGCTAQWATSPGASPCGPSNRSTSAPRPRSTSAGTRGDSDMWKPSSPMSQPMRSWLAGSVAGGAAVAEEGLRDRFLAAGGGLEVQAAQLDADDQGVLAGGGHQRGGGPYGGQGGVATQVPEGQPPRALAEAEVACQMDVQARAGVARAGDDHEIADLGGGVGAGAIQRPPGRRRPELPRGRGERPHPPGGAGLVGVERVDVDHGGAPLDPAGLEHLCPVRLPSWEPAEEAVDDLVLLVDPFWHRGAQCLEPRGHGCTPSSPGPVLR